MGFYFVFRNAVRKSAHKEAVPDGDVKRCQNMNLSKADLFDEKIIRRLAKTENVRLGAVGNRPNGIDVHRFVQVDVNLHRSEVRVRKRTDLGPFISRFDIDCSVAQNAGPSLMYSLQ